MSTKKHEVEIEDDSQPMQVFAVAEANAEQAKNALAELNQRAAGDDEGEEGPGDDQVLSMSGSNCHRTRRRDILCSDTD